MLRVMSGASKLTATLPREPLMYRVLMAGLGPVLRRLFPITVEGLEHVPSSGPVILAVNHRSFCDSIFIPAVIDRRVTFIAKAEYFESWKTKWFFEAMGQIPVKRGGGHASLAALEAAASVLSSNNVFAIYPEGTRSVDGRLYKGRTGVARLALEPGGVVIAVGVKGTDRVQPIGSRRFKFGVPVTISFSKPMDFARLRERAKSDPLTLRRITDEIMFEISQLCGQEYVNSYAPKKGPAESSPAIDATSRAEVMRSDSIVLGGLAG